MIARIYQFLDEDLWKMSVADLSRARAFFIKYLKIIILSVRGFVEDRGPLRASALTLYALLSIVPIFAMLFGIAKGFGYETTLEKQLLAQIPEQEEILKQVVAFAKSMLANTRGGLVAGIGVAILFYTIIKVLSSIEDTFNDIWGIKKGRSMGRRFSDYLSLMVICPILIIASSSVTVFVSTYATRLAESTSIVLLSSGILLALKFIPYVLIWILFSFIYIFMPNTRVSYKSGILTGVIVGTVYQLVQITYISLQVGVSKYNAIYGSFAALPLFLVWLQLSWYIVLFGAEFSFVHQNFKSLEHESALMDISITRRKLLSLQVTHLLLKKFIHHETPPTTIEIAETLDIPLHILMHIIEDLRESGLIAELKAEDNEYPTFQPARDPSVLTIGYVIDALEKRGDEPVTSTVSKESEVFFEALAAFREIVKSAPENRLLKDI